jgi:anaerobic dimethyl sulfoxide reductase subunit A
MGKNPASGSRGGDTVRYTSCAYHCLEYCLLKVRVRGGRIASIEPDDTIHPGVAREGMHQGEEFISPGMIQRRPCQKAYAVAKMLDDPSRVIYPMKRAGERGEGRFERISWDEALNTIADKLTEAKEKYGPYSVFHSPYSGGGFCSFPLAPWLGVGVAGWGAHSLGAWQEAEAWVFGRDPMHDLAMTGACELTQDEPNIFKSKLIVLWGLNPAATVTYAFVHNLLQARERGIPIICIDPRYTASAEVLSDQWIPIRPNTDVAMMIAVANVWFKENLCDTEFVDRYVEPHGLRRWTDYVLGSEDGIDKTPQWAEKICGVPSATIVSFARLYARSKPVNLNAAMSLGRQSYGENPARAAMYLQALTGNTCIPGGTAAAESGLPPGFPGGPIPRADWQQKPPTYSPPILFFMQRWAKAVDLREKLDKGEIGKAEYNHLVGNVEGNPCPNIRLYIAETNNYMTTLPDTNQTIRALKKLDFCLVFAQYADMPTARYADILLPQIYAAFEGRNGRHGPWGLFSDFGGATGRYFVYRQKCVDAPGEVRPNDWVWTQVARRLGIAELYNPRMARVPDDRWEEAVEGVYREAYERWAATDEIAPLNPPGWEEFQKKPIFRFPMAGGPHYSFKSDISADRNPFRQTASGKIEFYSTELAKGPNYLAANEVPPQSGKCYGKGALPPMAEMTMGGRDSFSHEDAARYPLLMSSPHSNFRIHSWLDNNPWLRGDCYRHAIWMSVEDADARGIKDDDLVRVYNDLGEMIIPAYVTSRVVPGSVFVHHGAWYRPNGEETPLMQDSIDTGGTPNFLVHDHQPGVAIGASPTKGLVQVEKRQVT